MGEVITSAGERPERRDPLTIISTSGLPEPVQRLLRDVVGRSRLWNAEEAQVAIELVAHFHDGIESGRSVEQLLASFGDAKTAAKLIRRAKRRNRPLWWHAVRATTRATECVLIVYAALFAWMVFTHPNPSIDYWPIYREAFQASRVRR